MLSSGFFAFINEIFGINCVKILKQWMKISKQLASLRNRRIFLLHCRTKNIIPKHIINNIKCIYTLQLDEHPFKRDTDKILLKLRKSILNLEIKITIWKLQNLENHVCSIEDKAASMIPDDIFCEFKSRINNNFMMRFNIIKDNNLKKIVELEHSSCSISMKNNKSFIDNFTNIQLPPEVERILSFGPKFGVPLNKKEFPIPILVKDIEYCISLHNLPNENKDILRCKAINILTNFYNSSNKLDKYNPIVKDYNVTKRFIKNNSEILITKSDKGNSTVIVHKDEYYNYMKQMFSDEQTYKVLKVDPTGNYQRKAIALIKELNDNGYITDVEAKKMKKYNTVPPKAYGLRKTHKPSIMYRPVISNINAPSYQLSTMIHKILIQSSSVSQYNIKNSNEIVCLLKTIKIPKNYILISLDVISMFPSIPKKLVIDIIKENWSFLESYTSIPKTEFLKIIDFIFESSFFKFDNQFYKQLDGTAMGNPSSPSIANLVMEYAITKILKTLDFNIPFFKLYVDDSIMAIPRGKESELLKTFNEFNKNIQFTLEKESDGTIAFLDLLLIRNKDGSIDTRWYSKPTSSNRILNYYSNHPAHQKINCARNLIERCKNLTSVHLLPESLKEMKNILSKNNYPKSVINMVSNMSFQHYHQNIDPVPPTKYFCKFPYINGLSQQLEKLFRKEQQCKPVFYNLKSVNNIFSSIKNQDDIKDKSEVIYKINCKNCEKCYIGQTRQKLGTRIKQHEYDCRLTNINNKEKTALSIHRFQEEQNFDFTNTKILDNESHHLKTNISEMIFIALNRSECINSRSDTFNLSSQYKGILSNYKNIQKIQNSH